MPEQRRRRRKRRSRTSRRLPSVENYAPIRERNYNKPRVSQKTQLGLVTSLLVVLAGGAFLFLNRADVDHYERAVVLRVEGRHGAALSSLRKLLLNTPDDAEYRFMYGDSLLRTGDYPEALTQLATAYEGGYRTPQSLQALARALIETNNDDKALALIRQARETGDSGAWDTLEKRALAKTAAGSR